MPNNRWVIPDVLDPTPEEPGYANAITRNHTGVNFNFGAFTGGVHTWTVAQVNNVFATQLEATPDPAIHVLPDVSLDALISTWPSADVLALTAHLDAKGVTRNFRTSDSLRTALNELGQQIEPTFNSATYDAESIPV